MPQRFSGQTLKAWMQSNSLYLDVYCNQRKVYTISSKNTFLTSAMAAIYVSAQLWETEKSSFFLVPILVRLKVYDNPNLYKGFEAKKLPAGIIVTPTIGLAGNIVYINCFLKH